MTLARSFAGEATDPGERDVDIAGPVAATSRGPLAPLRSHATGPAPVVFSLTPGGMLGGGACGACQYPPDPHGAVGPAGILHVVNTSLAYYGRDGALKLGGNDAKLIYFFNTPDRLIDPHARYDLGSGRFIITGVDRHTESAPYSNVLHIAVSRTSDPTTLDSTSWYFYSTSVMDTTSGWICWGDYPTVGVDSTALYVSFNMFGLQLPFFDHSRVYAFRKSGLLSGQLEGRSFNAGYAFTLQPVTVLGHADPGAGYFADVVMQSTTQLRLWALPDPFGTGTLTSTIVTIPDHGGQIEGAPQCDGGPAMYCWSPRAMGDAFWCDGSLWVCHTAGYPSGRSIVFYYRVATNDFPSAAPSLLESGGIDGGPGVWNYMPAIGGTASGDVGLVFTQSSATECPTMMATARRAGDTGFPAPIVIATSPTRYLGTDPALDNPYARWGDYAAVAPDPVDSSLWVCHELAHGVYDRDLWQTQWAELQIPDRPMHWQSGGEPLRSAATPVERPLTVADGSGGSFVAWVDERLPEAAAYVQHLAADGAIVPGWPFAGLRLGDVWNRETSRLAIEPDGAGGLYVAWSPQYPLRLQRLTAAGVVAPGWPADGLALTTGMGGGTDLSLARDGTSGVLVAWSGGGIHVQQVGSDGTVAWTEGGVSLSSSGRAPQVVSDDSAGAIVAWAPSARVQRIVAGVPVWASGGVSLCPGLNAPRVAPDGAHGAYVAVVAADGTGASVFVQRVRPADGAPASGWSAGGVRLTPAGHHPAELQLSSDRLGGAVAAWTDDRDATVTGSDVYASRILAEGTIALGWAPGGVPVCTAPGDQIAPSLSVDAAQGTSVAWTDYRNGEADVFAQVIGAEGTRLASQPVDGVEVCAAPGEQAAPSVAATASGTAVVAWTDGRLAPACDLGPTCGLGVYAQRLAFDDIPPAPVTDLTGTGGRTTAAVFWTEPGDDGLLGKAARFDLRLATTPIATDSAFAAASPVASTPAPLGAGHLACASLDGLASCGTYHLALRTIDAAGNESPLGNDATLTTTCTGDAVVQCEGGELAVSPAGSPRTLELAAPRPNPTTGGFTVTYGVPATAEGRPLELALFDVAGRRLATIERGIARAGYHSIAGGTPAPDRARSAGVYFLKLRVGDRELTRSLTRLR